MRTTEEKHTQLYRDILEILQGNFYPLGEKDDDAQCAEMIVTYFESKKFEIIMPTEEESREKIVHLINCVENYGMSVLGALRTFMIWFRDEVIHKNQ